MGFSLSPSQFLDPWAYEDGHSIVVFPDFSNSFFMEALPFNTVLYVGGSI